MRYPAIGSKALRACSGSICHLRTCLLFVGLNHTLMVSLVGALSRVQQGLQPHIRNQYLKQFKLYLAFVISRGFVTLDNMKCVLLFLVFLAVNSLSFRVINNYMSAMKFYFELHAWSMEALESHLVKCMLRGIKTSVQTNSTPRGLFTLHQIHEICRLCDEFDDALTYRLAFSLGFSAPHLGVGKVIPEETNIFYHTPLLQFVNSLATLHWIEKYPVLVIQTSAFKGVTLKTADILIHLVTGILFYTLQLYIAADVGPTAF